MSWLVLFDTDRIQDYIFAAPTLKEIRGASALLDRLNRQDTRELLQARGGEEIYLGGGGGAALFQDPAAAETFGEDLERLYREETIAGSITRVVQEIVEANFYQGLKLAERFLRRGKESKARPVSLTANPLMRVCELCGCRPAAAPRPNDPSARLICRACLLRHEESPAYKHSLIYLELEQILGQEVPAWPEDLEDIGEQSQPQGYLGLISADGNRAGTLRTQYLEKIQAEGGELREAYVRFSRTLDGATRRAAVEAAAECLGAPITGQRYPVQFFISGGDDLLLAVPANLALPLAICFCKKFEHYFEHGSPPHCTSEAFEGLGLKATMSVGVAIAKDHYPLNSLRQSAHELLRSAKALSWKRYKQQEEVSALDAVATSASQLKPLAAQRQEELEYDNLSLYQRPSPVEDFETLITAIRRLKASGFPRNKLMALGEALFGGRLQACLDCLVVVSRLSQEGNPSPREALLRLRHDFNLGHFPWRLKQGQAQAYETPLLDLIELYEFIH